jgi:hypothetical protein
VSRAFLVGLWVCVVTLLSSYGAVVWMTGARAEADEQAYLEGIEYKKVQPLTVPMIKGGQIQGYVVARFVFTADARTLRNISVTPGIFVADEAFRYIYSTDRIDFEKIKKYDIETMTGDIRMNVNKRLNAEIIQDILIEDLNYVHRGDIRS